MAVALTNLDIGTRYALEEDFTNGFVGRDRQIVIKTDDPKGYRPVIMDGTTQGGKNKVALVDDLADYVPVTTYNIDKATFVTQESLTSSLATKANTSHTHAQSDITGLSDALDAKANTSHSHNQSDVVGLTDALAGKAASVHTHEIANVNGLQTALDSKQAAGNYSTVGHTHTKAEITNFAHTHVSSDVTGLDAALAAKANATDLTSLIPKASSRGELAGYETPLVQATALTINGNSRDSNLVTGAVAITVSDGAASQSWTKTVALSNASATISLGSNWKWVGGTAPSVSANCVVVLHWCNSFGIANLAATS